MGVGLGTWLSPYSVISGIDGSLISSAQLLALVGGLWWGRGSGAVAGSLSILSHIWDRWKLDFISTVVGIGRGVWWGQREWRGGTTFRTNLLGLMVNIDYTDPRDQLGCPMLQESSQRD